MYLQKLLKAGRMKRKHRSGGNFVFNGANRKRRYTIPLYLQGFAKRKRALDKWKKLSNAMYDQKFKLG